MQQPHLKEEKEGKKREEETTAPCKEAGGVGLEEPAPPPGSLFFAVLGRPSRCPRSPKNRTLENPFKITGLLSRL